MNNQLPLLSTLTLIGFELNAAIERHPEGYLSFSEVYSALRQETLLTTLNTRLPGLFDFSLFPPGSEQSIALHQSLKQAADGLEGQERRKVGTIASGLHLVIALILEAIQRQLWVASRRP